MENQSTPINFQVGKTYITRDKRHKVTISAINTKCKHPIIGEIDGYWYIWGAGGKSITTESLDLVSEVFEPQKGWGVIFGNEKAARDYFPKAWPILPIQEIPKEER